MAKWDLINEQANIQLMSQTLGISSVMAQAMVNRGIRTKNTALRFLNPHKRFLRDPMLMADMDAAVKLLAKSSASGEKIAVYGDYDVDGVMSSVILLKTLQDHGANAYCVIPDREREGYGLNMEAVRRISVEANVIVACDNGIASVPEIEEAKRLGMKVVVFDHHEAGFTQLESGEKTEDIPCADAVVDPKQERCEYPFKMLCAAGIAFKFAGAFYEYNGKPFVREKEFLALAMMATFCDVVDLLDENRIIAKLGLDALNEYPTLNAGLYALIKEKGFAAKDIGGYAIGFVLGPCINATGRLESAALAVELFTTDDQSRAEELAKTLAELNEIRRAMTAQSFESAAEIIETTELKNQPVMVLFHRDIHESIAGIVAGRLKERYHKPVLVLTPSVDFPESHFVKGSARSIESYNIFEEMSACKDLFERFGGHAMAAGVTLKAENVPELRKRLNENCKLTKDDFVEIIRTDKIIPLSEVTYRLAEELSQMAPFGKANKEPLFQTYKLAPCALRVIESKNTLIFTFWDEKTNRKIKAVCFGKVDAFKTALAELYDEQSCLKILGGVLREAKFKMDVVYAIDINEYNGSVSVQMNIKDFKLNNDSAL